MSIFCLRVCAIVIIYCAVLITQPSETASVRDLENQSFTLGSSKLFQKLRKSTLLNGDKMTTDQLKQPYIKYLNRRKRITHHGHQKRMRKPSHINLTKKNSVIPILFNKQKRPLISFKDIESNKKNKRSHLSKHSKSNIGHTKGVLNSKLAGNTESLKIVPKSRKRRRSKRFFNEKENPTDDYSSEYKDLPISDDYFDEFEDVKEHVLYSTKEEPNIITPRVDKRIKSDDIVQITPRPVYNSRNYFDAITGIKLPIKVTIDPIFNMKPRPNDSSTYGGQLIKKRQAMPPVASQSVTLTIPNNFSSLNLGIPFTVAHQDIAISLTNTHPTTQQPDDSKFNLNTSFDTNNSLNNLDWSYHNSGSLTSEDSSLGYGTFIDSTEMQTCNENINCPINKFKDDDDNNKKETEPNFSDFDLKTPNIIECGKEDIQEKNCLITESNFDLSTPIGTECGNENICGNDYLSTNVKFELPTLNETEYGHKNLQGKNYLSTDVSLALKGSDYYNLAQELNDDTLSNTCSFNQSTIEPTTTSCVEKFSKKTKKTTSSRTTDTSKSTKIKLTKATQSTTSNNNKEPNTKVKKTNNLTVRSTIPSIMQKTESSAFNEEHNTETSKIISSSTTSTTVASTIAKTRSAMHQNFTRTSAAALNNTLKSIKQPNTGYLSVRSIIPFITDKTEKVIFNEESENLEIPYLQPYEEQKNNENFNTNQPIIISEADEISNFLLPQTTPFSLIPPNSELKYKPNFQKELIQRTSRNLLQELKLKRRGIGNDDIFKGNGFYSSSSLTPDINALIHMSVLRLLKQIKRETNITITTRSMIDIPTSISSSQNYETSNTESLIVPTTVSYKADNNITSIGIIPAYIYPETSFEDTTITVVRRDDVTSCIPSTCDNNCEASTCPPETNTSASPNPGGTTLASEPAPSELLSIATSPSSGSGGDVFRGGSGDSSITVGVPGFLANTAGGGCQLPCNMSNTLSEILHRVEMLAEQKFGGAEDFACSLNGTWASEAAGVKFNIAASEERVNNISIEPPDIDRQTGFMSNSKWQLSAMLPIVHSGIIIINGVNEKDKTVASFIGEYKHYPQKGEIIWGHWLINQKNIKNETYNRQSVFDALEKVSHFETQKRNSELSSTSGALKETLQRNISLRSTSKPLICTKKPILQRMFGGKKTIGQPSTATAIPVTGNEDDTMITNWKTETSNETAATFNESISSSMLDNLASLRATPRTLLKPKPGANPNHTSLEASAAFVGREGSYASYNLSLNNVTTELCPVGVTMTTSWRLGKVAMNANKKTVSVEELLYPKEDGTDVVFPNSEETTCDSEEETLINNLNSEEDNLYTSSSIESTAETEKDVLIDTNVTTTGDDLLSSNSESQGTDFVDIADEQTMTSTICIIDIEILTHNTNLRDNQSSTEINIIPTYTNSESSIASTTTASTISLASETFKEESSTARKILRLFKKKSTLQEKNTVGKLSANLILSKSPSTTGYTSETITKLPGIAVQLPKTISNKGCVVDFRLLFTTPSNTTTPNSLISKSNQTVVEVAIDNANIQSLGSELNSQINIKNFINTSQASTLEYLNTQSIQDSSTRDFTGSNLTQDNQITNSFDFSSTTLTLLIQDPNITVTSQVNNTSTYSTIENNYTSTLNELLESNFTEDNQMNDNNSPVIQTATLTSLVQDLNVTTKVQVNSMNYSNTDSTESSNTNKFIDFNFTQNNKMGSSISEIIMTTQLIQNQNITSQVNYLDYSRNENIQNTNNYELINFNSTTDNHMPTNNCSDMQTIKFTELSHNQTVTTTTHINSIGYSNNESYQSTIYNLTVSNFTPENQIINNTSPDTQTSTLTSLIPDNNYDSVNIQNTNLNDLVVSNLTQDYNTALTNTYLESSILNQYKQTEVHLHDINGLQHQSTPLYKTNSHDPVDQCILHLLQVNNHEIELTSKLNTPITTLSSIGSDGLNENTSVLESTHTLTSTSNTIVNSLDILLEAHETTIHRDTNDTDNQNLTILSITESSFSSSLNRNSKQFLQATNISDHNSFSTNPAFMSIVNNTKAQITLNSLGHNLEDQNNASPNLNSMQTSIYQLLQQQTTTTECIPVQNINNINTSNTTSVVGGSDDSKDQLRQNTQILNNVAVNDAVSNLSHQTGNSVAVDSLTAQAVVFSTPAEPPPLGFNENLIKQLATLPTPSAECITSFMAVSPRTMLTHPMFTLNFSFPQKPLNFSCIHDSPINIAEILSRCDEIAIKNTAIPTVKTLLGNLRRQANNAARNVQRSLQSIPNQIVYQFVNNDNNTLRPMLTMLHNKPVTELNKNVNKQLNIPSKNANKTKNVINVNTRAISKLTACLNVNNTSNSCMQQNKMSPSTILTAVITTQMKVGLPSCITSQNTTQGGNIAYAQTISTSEDCSSTQSTACTQLNSRLYDKSLEIALIPNNTNLTETSRKDNLNLNTAAYELFQQQPITSTTPVIQTTEYLTSVPQISSSTNSFGSTHSVPMSSTSCLVQTTTCRTSPSEIMNATTSFSSTYFVPINSTTCLVETTQCLTSVPEIISNSFGTSLESITPTTCLLKTAECLTSSLETISNSFGSTPGSTPTSNPMSPCPLEENVNTSYGVIGPNLNVALRDANVSTTTNVILMTNQMATKDLIKDCTYTSIQISSTEIPSVSDVILNSTTIITNCLVQTPLKITSNTPEETTTPTLNICNASTTTDIVTNSVTSATVELDKSTSISCEAITNVAPISSEKLVELCNTNVCSQLHELNIPTLSPLLTISTLEPVASTQNLGQVNIINNATILCLPTFSNTFLESTATLMWSNLPDLSTCLLKQETTCLSKQQTTCLPKQQTTCLPKQQTTCLPTELSTSVPLPLTLFTPSFEQTPTLLITNPFTVNFINKTVSPSQIRCLGQIISAESISFDIPLDSASIDKSMPTTTPLIEITSISDSTNSQFRSSCDNVLLLNEPITILPECSSSVIPSDVVIPSQPIETLLPYKFTPIPTQTSFFLTQPQFTSYNNQFHVLYLGKPTSPIHLTPNQVYSMNQHPTLPPDPLLNNHQVTYPLYPNQFAEVPSNLPYQTSSILPEQLIPCQHKVHVNNSMNAQQQNLLVQTGFSYPSVIPNSPPSVIQVPFYRLSSTSTPIQSNILGNIDSMAENCECQQESLVKVQLTASPPQETNTTQCILIRDQIQTSSVRNICDSVFDIPPTKVQVQKTSLGTTPISLCSTQRTLPYYHINPCGKIGSIYGSHQNQQESPIEIQTCTTPLPDKIISPQTQSTCSKNNLTTFLMQTTCQPICEISTKAVHDQQTPPVPIQSSLYELPCSSVHFQQNILGNLCSESKMQNQKQSQNGSLSKAQTFTALSSEEMISIQSTFEYELPLTSPSCQTNILGNVDLVVSDIGSYQSQQKPQINTQALTTTTPEKIIGVQPSYSRYKLPTFSVQTSYRSILNLSNKKGQQSVNSKLASAQTLSCELSQTLTSCKVNNIEDVGSILGNEGQQKQVIETQTLTTPLFERIKYTFLRDKFPTLSAQTAYKSLFDVSSREIQVPQGPVFPIVSYESLQTSSSYEVNSFENVGFVPGNHQSQQEPPIETQTVATPFSEEIIDIPYTLSGNKLPSFSEETTCNSLFDFLTTKAQIHDPLQSIFVTTPDIDVYAYMESQMATIETTTYTYTRNPLFAFLHKQDAEPDSECELNFMDNPNVLGSGIVNAVKNISLNNIDSNKINNTDQITANSTVLDNCYNYDQITPTPDQIFISCEYCKNSFNEGIGMDFTNNNATNVNEITQTSTVLDDCCNFDYMTTTLNPVLLSSININNSFYRENGIDQPLGINLCLETTNFTALGSLTTSQSTLEADCSIPTCEIFDLTPSNYSETWLNVFSIDVVETTTELAISQSLAADCSIPSCEIFDFTPSNYSETWLNVFSIDVVETTTELAISQSLEADCSTPSCEIFDFTPSNYSETWLNVFSIDVVETTTKLPTSYLNVNQLTKRTKFETLSIPTNKECLEFTTNTYINLLSDKDFPTDNFEFKTENSNRTSIKNSSKTKKSITTTTIKSKKTKKTKKPKKG